MSLSDDKGRPVQLGARIGGGGEGDVFEVVGQPLLVAKVYHQPTPERGRKLQAMLQNPPPDPSSGLNHVSICWPQRLLYRHGACVGFLMHRVDGSRCIELLKLYSHRDRVTNAPAFTWRYLMRAAANVASVVDALHARGYVVGDLNESNVLVTTSALVVIVDCDSMQVPIPGGGGYFRCPVGKPELTAPELQSANFSLVDRNPAHDRFALGVMIFLMMMEGVHPFAGVWRAAGVDPPVGERIERGDSPYAGSRNVTPMPAAPPFDMLPDTLRKLFERCFRAGGRNPGSRPPARDWRNALVAAEATLITCRRNSQHVYANHNAGCPWCARTTLLGGYDPYPAPGASLQTALPPVSPFGRAAAGSNRPAAPVYQPPPPYQPPYRPPAAAPAVPGTPGDRGRRLGAVILDVISLAACFLPVLIGGGMTHGAESTLEGEATLSVVVLAVVVIWQLTMLHRHAQTVGKRLVGLRIVRSNGAPASLLWIFFWRGLAAGLPGALLFLMNPRLPLPHLYALADVLFIFGPARRCLHDRIAGTFVVAAPAVALSIGKGVLALIALAVVSVMVANGTRPSQIPYAPAYESSSYESSAAVSESPASVAARASEAYSAPYDTPVLSCGNAAGGGQGGLSFLPGDVRYQLSSRSAGQPNTTEITWGASYRDSSLASEAYTGSLRVRLMALSASFSGGRFSGHVVAVSYLNLTGSGAKSPTQIFNGWNADSHLSSAAGTNPPAGSYCMVLFLEQYNESCAEADHYCYNDWVQFPQAETFR